MKKATWWVVKEPGKRARVQRMAGDLAQLQAAVGGYIEVVTRAAREVEELGAIRGAENLQVIVNEEGLLQGLAPNILGLVGPVVVCRFVAPDDLRGFLQESTARGVAAMLDAIGFCEGQDA